MGKIESALFFRNTIDRSVFEGPLGGWGRLSRSQGLRVFQRRDRGVDVFAGRKREFRRALYAPLTKPSTSPFEVVERQTVGTRVKKITRTFVQSRGPHPAPLVVLRAVQLFVEGYPRALYDFDERQGDVQGDWNEAV